jgi:hypothetical protein
MPHDLADVEALIVLAKKHGVAHLRVGGVELRFAAEQREPARVVPLQRVPQIHDTEPPPDMTAEERSEVEAFERWQRGELNAVG